MIIINDKSLLMVVLFSPRHASKHFVNFQNSVSLILVNVAIECGTDGTVEISLL